ncbi:hypothetical protein IT087_04035 [Candidatus Uhrbacteria bacterium]|nr:hypothetical protein [Candidatus Uhrbacteria bacterium]
MQGLKPFVNAHASIRYAHRVLGRKVEYIGALSSEERDMITRKILEITTVGRVLVAREVMLFVRGTLAHDSAVSRVFRAQSPDASSPDSVWGTYHMHDDVIAVLDKDPERGLVVKTIIAPDENQLRTLEDLMRPPVPAAPAVEPSPVETAWRQPASIEILVAPAAWSAKFERSARFLQKWVSRIPQDRRMYCEAVFQESLKRALHDHIRPACVPRCTGKRASYLSSLDDWIKTVFARPMRGQGSVFLVCEEAFVHELLPRLPCNEQVKSDLFSAPIVPGHIHGLHVKRGRIQRYECVYKPARSTSA